ncbi:MAG: alpha/beta hydrolase [Gammaproteobacteria bacterium]|nr:alpha/beta hydrolase [Gammaproteobacteria bacterium]
MTATYIIISILALAAILYWAGRLLVDWLSKRVAEPPPPPAPAGTRVIRDVEFASTPHGPLLLDIYMPDTSADAPLPVLMYIFGGGWFIGNRHQVSALHWQNIAQHGYAVVCISYRLSHLATFPSQIHDCKKGLRWIRKNAEKYNFDPHRIGVFGSSAGGHLSALMGTSGDVLELEGPLEEGDENYLGPVQAVADFMGPTDFAQAEAQRRKPGVSWASRRAIAARLLGDRVANVPELVKAANPLTYIKPGMPPFFIVHGEKDRVVPLGQSVILHEALQASGNESELMILEGKGHTHVKAYGTDEIFSKLKAFFDRHLKPQSLTV